MKIALLGAPGSGKTKLARSLQRKLGDDWRIVDGYMDRLTKHTGYSYGPTAHRGAFRYEIEVLGTRWVEEDRWLHQGFNTITCGSIYEGIIYAAAQGVPIPRLGDEQLILAESQIAQTMMGALGLLSIIAFDYDALFYLPLPEPQGHNWNTVVNAQILSVLEGQFKQAITLNGTHKEKTEQALNAITTIKDTLASYEQQTVRPRDDTRSGDEHQSESVSDMSSKED